MSEETKMIPIAQFEKWLISECFQEPTPEAYDLSKSAWLEATRQAYAECSNVCEGLEIPDGVEDLSYENALVDCAKAIRQRLQQLEHGGGE